MPIFFQQDSGNNNQQFFDILQTLMWYDSWKLFHGWCKRRCLMIRLCNWKQLVRSESFYQFVKTSFATSSFSFSPSFKQLNLKFILEFSECTSPVDEVIKAGVVPRLVEFLGRHDFPHLQVCIYVLLFSLFFETFTSLQSGDYVALVVF